MCQFVLKVQDLDEGVSDHRFALTSEWLANQLADVEGIDGAEKEGLVELSVTRRGREVLVRGSIRATLRVDCVRCLEGFPFDVEASLEVLMLRGRPQPKAAQENEGDGRNNDEGDGRNNDEGDGRNNDELGVERYKGDQIELDELVRDTILLEVPMNPNCGDTCFGWDNLHQEGGGTR